MSEKKKLSIKMLLLLQAVVVIYTFAGVCGKFAGNYPLLSLEFIFWFGGEVLILGIYAVLWQQIIKRVDLSIAYANRSIALIWSMLWAYLIFHDTEIGWQNIIGVIIIVIGTMIVNSDHE